MCLHAAFLGGTGSAECPCYLGGKLPVAEERCRASPLGFRAAKGELPYVAIALCDALSAA